MHIFLFSFYCTTLIYVIYCQFWLIYCFGGFILIYCLISAFYPSAKDLSTRRKFTLATWSAPSQGIIYNNLKLRIDKLLAYIATFPSDKTPTITHYVIRACGQILKQNPDLNGKLIFGKFIPYQTCDVSCLVNIDGQQDVGMFLVKDVPNKTITQIGQQIRTRAKKMKPKGGDQIHSKRMKLMNILPSFLISILYQVSIFLSSYLGINNKALGLEKDALGAMIVSSVGSFGYTDAYTAFFGTVGQWILLTVNAPHQEVIVNNGKIQIATMININCVIDHRYLYSGARGQKLVQIFQSVFENPEKYVSISQKNKGQ